MKPEDFKAKMSEVLSNLNDQAKVSTILAEITEVYDKETVVKTEAIKKAETLTADNESLRKANMSLFLKVGEQKQEEQQKTPVDNTPKFDDLFDEKGNLK